MSHASNSLLVGRLRRAHGHLDTVVRMVEEGRDCLDIAQQMQAVIKALENAKTALIRDHIQHHLEDATGSLSKAARDSIAGLSELAKYL